MLSLNLQLIKNVSSENRVVKMCKQEVRPRGSGVCCFSRLICVNGMAEYIQIPQADLTWFSCY